MGKRTARQSYASWASSKAGLQVRAMIVRQQLGLCYHCKRPTPINEVELDHLAPLAQGGGNDLSNLYASCRECNRAKGATLSGVAQSIPWWIEARLAYT
jgi:5-methylcytosine-specific restriction protein A